MLDKSIPYFNVIMKRSSNIPIDGAMLPKGFSWSFFVDGSENGWAEIVSSVGEFESKKEALLYFQKNYFPHGNLLKERVIFIQTEDKEKVGTITCWWDYTKERKDPSIHWLAVKEGFQGLGLGKALVCKALQRLLLLEGNQDVFLHTQTWSHRAIRIYLKAGFEIVETESFGSYKNDYKDAMHILSRFSGIVS